MDLVKTLAVGGAALMAMLTLAATSHHAAAQSPFGELPTGVPVADVRQPVDDTSESARSPLFALSGPIAPVPKPRVPVLPQQPSATRWLEWSSTSMSAWRAFIDEASRRFGVPADWVRGVMQIESGGRTTLNGRPITSSAGAMGLMQVMPATFGQIAGATDWATIPTIHAPTSSLVRPICARCTTVTAPLTVVSQGVV